MFTKPRDREVVCHASAWDVTYDDDLRIKMCIEPTEEDLVTIHHELGHNYYQHAYYKLPVLFQDGRERRLPRGASATRSRSRVTPGVPEEGRPRSTASPKDDKGRINFQMKMALDKIAFLPFGLLIDKWRWDVFSGKGRRSEYNEAWWELRAKYQGVDAPVARSEADFDPGAKYHIPANVAVHALLPRAHLPVPVPPRALQGRRAARGRSHSARSTATRRRASGSRRCCSSARRRPWPEALAALTGASRRRTPRRCSSTSRRCASGSQRAERRASSAAGDARADRDREMERAPRRHEPPGRRPARDAGARCRGPGRDRGRARPRASPLPSRHRCPGGSCPSSPRASPRPGVERSLVAPPTRSFTSPLISSILPLIWSLFIQPSRWPQTYEPDRDAARACARGAGREPGARQSRRAGGAGGAATAAARRRSGPGRRRRSRRPGGRAGFGAAPSTRRTPASRTA